MRRYLVLNIYKYIYLISFFMLMNGLFFNYYLHAVGIPFWRQALWIVYIVIFIRIIKSKHPNFIRLLKVQKYLIICTFIIVLFSLKTIFIDHFNLQRVAYSAIFYLYGIPFIGLLCIFTNDKQQKYKLFTLFSYIGIFMSLGLIIDNNFPIFTKFKLEEMLEGNSRSTFFSESPTVLGISYNFLMLCTCYKVYVSKKFSTKTIYSILLFLYIAGAWVTGSRQILFIILFSLFIFIISALLKNIKNIKYAVIPTLFCFILLNSSVLILFDKSNYSEYRYSIESVQDDERSLLWKEGVKQLSISNFPYFVVGRGIGLTVGKFSKSGEVSGSHFENTFFALFSEMGIFSWYILFYPIIMILLFFFRKKLTVFSIILLTSLISYLFISFVSPNGFAPQSQITVYLILGMFLYRDYYDIDY